MVIKNTKKIWAKKKKKPKAASNLGQIPWQSAMI